MQYSKKFRIYAVILLAATYFASYMTRYDFAATISAMVSDTGISSPMLSIAVSCAFVTYGVGQLVSGFFGDKIKPRSLIAGGLIISACMNLLIPFMTEPIGFTIIWGINGFAQSFIWPPIVKTIAAVFPGEQYKKAVTATLYGGYIGNMTVYIVPWFTLEALGWRGVFRISSAIALVIALLWILPKTRIEAEKAEPEKITAESPLVKNKFPSKAFLLIIPVFLAIILQGAFKDGVGTWIPSYMNSAYSLGESFSIGLCFMLPIAGIVFVSIGDFIYPKIFKTPVSSSLFLFGTSLVSAALLYFFCGRSFIFDIVAFFIIIGGAHGVNYMLVSLLPKYFRSTGFVSLISGILNSFTYVGSALSTYGIASITENAGWNTSFLLYTFIGLAGTLLCIISIPLWKKASEYLK